jgi:lysozyme
MSKGAGKAGFIAVPAIVIAALIAALQVSEKRVHTTYWDALGQVWTACAGVTGEGVIPGKTYTDAECDALEGRYVKRMYQRMGRCVTRDDLEFYEIKAWGHFAYNVGESNFCKSTAARLLNAGKNAEACRQIGRWVFVKGKDCRVRASKCPGIVKRRQWEEKTCLGELS